MKIQTKHLAQAIIQWEGFSQAEVIQHTEKLFDRQPKVGGQLAALIMRENIPVEIVEDGVTMTCIMLHAVELASCSLPQMTHEMFEKEQRNLAAFYHIKQEGETGVQEAMLKGHQEKALLSYTVNKINEFNFIGRHPQGWLLAVVVHSICNLIDQNISK